MYDFGENIFMNNEKYLDELDGRLQVLNELRKRIIELSKAIIGDTLYKEDFFFTSAMDRSVVLSVIKEIVGQIIKRDIKMTDSPKILIVSQSHTAVDNILEGLGKAIDNPLEIIRIGAERNISEEIATKYTIAAHREQLVSEIKNNVQQYVEQKNDLMNTITDKNEVKKWEEVKKIQEDWINRLVDQNSLDYQMIRSAVVIAGTCVGFLSNEVIKDMNFCLMMKYIYQFINMH